MDISIIGLQYLYIQLILDLPLGYTGVLIFFRKQIAASVLKQKSKCLRISMKTFLSNKSYSTKCKFCSLNNSTIY